MLPLLLPMLLLLLMLPSATLDDIVASEKPRTLSALLVTGGGSRHYTGFVDAAPFSRASGPIPFRPPSSWRLEALAVLFLKVLDDFPRRVCRLLESSGVEGGLVLCRL